MLLRRLIFTGLLAVVSLATTADQPASNQAKKTIKHPTIETSWLSGEAGFKGQLLGAEIVSVSPSQDDDTKNTVEVTIPVPHGNTVEEVIVIEQANPSLKKPEIKYDVKVVKDYKGGRSGVVITLGKDVPFKLMFNYVEYGP